MMTIKLGVLAFREFSDAGITRISKGTFTSLYELKYLYLPWNRVKSLSSLEDGVFWEKGYGLELNLGYNAITNVTAADMKGKEMLFSLQLNDNRISYIEGGAFNACTQLRTLNLSTNNIRRLEPYTFPSSFSGYLDLRSNRLEEITYDVFGRFRDTIRMNFYNNTISKIEPRALDFGYTELDLRVNNLTDVSSVHPSPYSTLMKLLLGQNKITKFSPDILVGSRSLNFLDISDISLGRITVDLLKDLKQLVLLNAVRANIHHIDDFAFGGAKRISYIFLDNNYLTRISKNTFVGPRWLYTLTLVNNPIEVIEEGAFSKFHDLYTLYLVGSKVQMIDFGSTFSSRSLTIALFSGKNLPGVEGEFFTQSILRASGYECPRRQSAWETCYPCTQGQYKIDGSYFDKCTDCPPGGFYQDSIAHVGVISHGLGCKQCPVGAYVSPALTPGRVEGDCSACPDGTDMKKFAGFRACPCLPGYFRLNRFGMCKPCPYGYYCSNESVNLMPGFYWTWQQPNHTQEYQTFASKLQEESKQHDRDWDSFNGSLPMAYRCPFTGSCKGDFNATCSHGYEGVLCAACSRGYYRMFSGCNKCPTTPLVITQFVGVFLVLALFAVVVILNTKKSRDDNRSQTDQLFGSLKIVIGFYQILSGTLNAYSYIQWPKELLTIMKYADVLQLNIFTIAPIECISDKLKVDPYSGMLGYVMMDCAVIFTAFFYYNVRKMVLTRRCRHDAKDTLFDCKANCYQAVFLFLFITYPAACTKIFQTLPAGCQEVCDNTGACKSYFRSDYAVECFSEQHNKFLYFVYASLIIPLLFPMICAFLLWQHCSEKHYIGTFAGLKKKINKMRGKSRRIAITSLKVTPGEDSSVAMTSLREKTREDRSIDITSLKETPREDRAIDIKSQKKTPGEERSINITILKETPREDRAIDNKSLKETPKDDRAIDIKSQKETPGEDRAIDNKSLKETPREDRAIDIKSQKETPGDDAIKKGLRFMYENYTKDCWYWEIIELLRKVTLTSLLAYYGQDNPFYLGTSAVLSGLYAVFFANQKPIRYVFEYWLHLGSLVAVMATQLMGMVLRIPGEDASVDQEADQLGVIILLIFANLFVIFMILVRYLYSMWVSLKAVRANPQCSMECLMNVMQIITQGEEETCKGRREISESQAEASGQEAVQEIH